MLVPSTLRRPCVHMDPVRRHSHGSDKACPNCGFSRMIPFGSWLPPREGSRTWSSRRPWHLPVGFPGGLESWDSIGCEWHAIQNDFFQADWYGALPHWFRECCEEVEQFLMMQWASRRVNPADTRYVREKLRQIAAQLEQWSGPRGTRWMLDAADRVREFRDRLPSHAERFYPQEDWLDGLTDFEDDCDRRWSQRPWVRRRRSSPLGRSWNRPLLNL